jgi:hypothetical protein
VRAGAIGDPISGDVVVLAVWYQVLDDVLGRYAGQLDGKVVVDITNPVDPQTFQPLNVAAGSAAQEIAQKVPGAKVAKAFNTTFAGTLVAGQVGGQPLDVFVASDDEDAKACCAASPRTVGCASSTPARSPSRASSKAPATCTWRSRASSAPPTGARSRSFRSRRAAQEGVDDALGVPRRRLLAGDEHAVVDRPDEEIGGGFDIEVAASGREPADRGESPAATSAATRRSSSCPFPASEIDATPSGRSVSSRTFVRHSWHTAPRRPRIATPIASHAYRPGRARREATSAFVRAR